MKLLVDMNLSPRWVKTLLEAEIEAAHWSSLGPANAADADIMAFAPANGYVVLTHDFGFQFDPSRDARREAERGSDQSRGCQTGNGGARSDRGLTTNGCTAGGRGAAHGRSDSSEIARATVGFEITHDGVRRRACGGMSWSDG